MPPTVHVPAPELRRYWPVEAGAVVMPVPPLAMGTVPVRLMLGLLPPLEAKGADAPTLSTPVLLKVRVPPSANVPPPLKPEPVFTVAEEFCNMALVTPALAMLRVVLPPRATLPPPLSPAPAVTVSEGLVSLLFVTPPFATATVGAEAVPPIAIEPSLAVTLATEPGNVCPAAKVIWPLLATLKPVSARGLLPAENSRFNVPEALLVLLLMGSVCQRKR